MRPLHVRTQHSTCVLEKLLGVDDLSMNGTCGHSTVFDDCRFFTIRKYTLQSCHRMMLGPSRDSPTAVHWHLWTLVQRWLRFWLCVSVHDARVDLLSHWGWILVCLIQRSEITRWIVSTSSFSSAPARFARWSVSFKIGLKLTGILCLLQACSQQVYVRACAHFSFVVHSWHALHGVRELDNTSASNKKATPSLCRKISWLWKTRIPLPYLGGWAATKFTALFAGLHAWSKMDAVHLEDDATVHTMPNRHLCPHLQACSPQVYVRACAHVSFVVHSWHALHGAWASLTTKKQPTFPDQYFKRSRALRNLNNN